MDNKLENDRIARVESAKFCSADYDKSKPTILTDVVSDWKACTRWSTDYLAGLLKEKRVEVGFSKDYKFDYGTDTPQFEIKNLSFEQAIHKIEKQEAGGSHYYIMQKAISVEFPELLPDIEMPFWLDKNNLAPHIWLGASGNFTSLHYDISDNYIAQVKGSKRFTLYDPSQAEFLYPNSVDNALSHVSRVDITDPDLTRFPDFERARPLEFSLQAGEMLYLPSHWWHAVSSECFSIMVNFWSFADNLELYLNNPTGIRSLWFIYKIDLLQSLKGLIYKNNLTFLDCAQKILSINPCAAILLAHAEIINFILTMGSDKNRKQKTIADLNDHLVHLIGTGVFSNSDLDKFQNWRFLAMQTFAGSDLTAKQSNEMILEIKSFISKFVNESA